MRILYVSGTYAPAAGGAETSAHELMREAAHQHQVRVLTDSRLRQRHGSGAFEGVPISYTRHEEREQAFLRVLDSYKPDLVLTQLMWSDVALRLARQTGVMSVLRVCKIPFSLNIASGAPHAPDYVIAGSAPAAEWIRLRWGRHSYTLESLIEPKRVLSAPSRRKYITMFNPIPHKGGPIFRSIAERESQRQFLAVRAWDILRTGGRFDPTLIGRLKESLGESYGGEVPVDTDFSGMPNVKVLPPQREVRSVFSRTRILLVPSQWEEVNGRVSTEAMLNGIPVIASAKGGLGEHVSGGGTLVEEFRDLDAWISAIRLLDKPEMYLQAAMRAKRFAEAHVAAQTEEKLFLTLLKELTGG